jgi:hypothetical protein
MNTTTDIFVFKLDSNGQITFFRDLSPGEPVVQVFPNPAAQQLIIQKPDDSDAITTIKIYDLTGALKQSMECNANKLNIDISGFTDGTYVVKGFTESGRQFRKKFIKIR